MDPLLQLAKEKLPAVRDWIHGTLTEYAPRARPVARLGFERLPRFFDLGLLDRAKVVVVEVLPTIPFRELGLSDFTEFGDMPAAGITYQYTYFILEPHASDEAIHFHELVHVIQWAELGMDGFLLAYAFGLLTMGYENSPLEIQARKHQLRFHRCEEPYDVRDAVREELATITAGLPPMPAI